MALNRKHLANNTFVSYDPIHDQTSTPEQTRTGASLTTNSMMNRIKPFFNGNKHDDPPECYNRACYIREACKVFPDLWKSDKDFLNKSIDNDVSKAFREFRSSDIARGYRSPYEPNGAPSILNSVIDDLIQIHENIDVIRKDWLERFRAVSDQAREKQTSIRQKLSDARDSCDQAIRKFDSAEANLRKFLTRSDSSTVQNYDERLRELEDTRSECERARKVARDIYATETYRIAGEEHSITVNFFAEYLFEEQRFYNEIQLYLSNQVPKIQHRLEEDKLAPSFRCDISEHCLKRIHQPIAYPIKTCVNLLKDSLKEQGLFRIAPAQGKQKKLAAELDLQMINEKATLDNLGYDAHVAASALKQYLRELPDCLLTEVLMPAWNEIPSFSTDEERIGRIGELLAKLPKVNYDNLRHIIEFLTSVAQNSSVNKMTASNLGICVGCNLLYPKAQLSNTSTQYSYSNSSSQIVELMILNCKQLFPSEDKTDIPQEPSTPYHSQPDLVQTVIQTKNQNPLNESLFDTQSVAGSTQPSPRERPKGRALVVPQINRQNSVQVEPTYIEETFPEQSPFAQITAPNEKHYHRSGSTDTELDRPIRPPPPIPPPYAQRLSSYNREREIPATKADNNTLLDSPISNDGVPVGILLPEICSIINNSNINPNQTNNNQMSSRHDNLSSSPGEITEF